MFSCCLPPGCSTIEEENGLSEITGEDLFSSVYFVIFPHSEDAAAAPVCRWSLTPSQAVMYDITGCACCVCSGKKKCIFLFNSVTAVLRKCQMSVMFFRINAFKWSQRRQYTGPDSNKCASVPLKCELFGTWHSSTQTQENCNCLTSVLCCDNTAPSY